MSEFRENFIVLVELLGAIIAIVPFLILPVIQRARDNGFHIIAKIYKKDKKVLWIFFALACNWVLCFVLANWRLWLPEIWFFESLKQFIYDYKWLLLFVYIGPFIVIMWLIHLFIARTYALLDPKESCKLIVNEIKKVQDKWYNITHSNKRYWWGKKYTDTNFADLTEEYMDSLRKIGFNAVKENSMYIVKKVILSFLEIAAYWITKHKNDVETPKKSRAFYYINFEFVSLSLDVMIEYMKLMDKKGRKLASEVIEDIFELMDKNQLFLNISMIEINIKIICVVHELFFIQPPINDYSRRSSHGSDQLKKLYTMLSSTFTTVKKYLQQETSTTASGFASRVIKVIIIDDRLLEILCTNYGSPKFLLYFGLGQIIAPLDFNKIRRDYIDIIYLCRPDSYYFKHLLAKLQKMQNTNKFNVNQQHVEFMIMSIQKYCNDLETTPAKD